MIQGAIIGAVVGLVIYFVQQQQKKKQANTEMLDDTVKEESTEK